MGLWAKDEQKPREKPSLGMHDAVCVFVCDVGTHKVQSQYGEKIQHKIVICWEIDEKIKTGDYAGKPFMQSKRYTLSLFKKATLSTDLESWLTKKIPDETRKNGIDLEKFVGRRCTLNLMESADGEYVNVAGVLPASKSNALVPVCTEVPKWIDKLRSESMEAKGEMNQDAEPAASQAPSDVDTVFPMDDNAAPTPTEEPLPF